MITMPIAPKDGKLLYHLTKIDNIPSVLKNGLMSRKKLSKSIDISFSNIADLDILEKRLKWKTDLSSYVPFHFYTKNPFDGAVCNKFGSENMAIIAIWRPTSNTDKRGMFIIPSHPLSNDEPDIYSYDDGFDLVDWDTLGDAENRDYHDPKIKSKCMAECLAKDSIPSSKFAFIFVLNDAAKNKIEDIANTYNVNIRVNAHMFP